MSDPQNTDESAIEEGVRLVLAANAAGPTRSALPAPIGVDEQTVHGDSVNEGAAIVEQWKRSQQPGFLKGLAGDVGRGVINVATPGLLINALSGQPGGREALALSQKVKHNLWRQGDPGLGEMIAHGTVEGLPTMVPDLLAGAVGGMLTGGPGAPVGFGLSAGLRSAAESTLQSFQEAGVDTANPLALSAAFNNPELMKTAGMQAAKHGLTDAAFAATVAALAGPVGNVATQISKSMPGAVRTATKLAAEGDLMGLTAAGQTAAHNAMDGRPLGEGVAESTLIGVAQGPVLSAGLRAVSGAKGAEKPANTPATSTPDMAFLDRWVAENPDKAQAIAEGEPSRRAFKRAGFPVPTHEGNRPEFQARIRELLREPDPATTSEATPDTTTDAAAVQSPDSLPRATEEAPTPTDPTEPSASTKPRDTATDETPNPTRDEAIQNRAREILDSGEALDPADATQQAKIEFARLERQDGNKAEPEDRPPSWVESDSAQLREKAAADREIPATRSDAAVLPDEALNTGSVDATEPASEANNRSVASEADPAQTRRSASASDAAASPDATTTSDSPTQGDAARLSANPLRYPFAGNKTSPPAKGLSAPSVVRWMSETFDVPVRYGKIAQNKALGIYKRLPQVIRLRGEEWANLEVAAHETAHHIDRTLGSDATGANYFSKKLPVGLRNELAKLDYDYPKQRRPQEGFAEYIAATTQGHDVSAQVPKFDAYWKQQLAANPELATKLAKMKELVRDFESQDPLQAIKSHMSETGQPRDAVDKPFIERTGDYLKDLGRRAIVQVFDTTYDLKLFDQRAKKQAARLGKSAPGGSAYILGREAIRSAATQGERAFKTSGAFRLSDPLESAIGPRLDDFVNAIKDASQDDVEAFALARHALTAQARGIETGLRPGDAKATFEKFKDDPRYVNGADILTKMNDALIDVMVDQRLLSPDDARAMRAAWGKDYVPLLRVRETEPSPENPSGTKPGSAFKRRVGSGAEIISPLVATARKYAAVYRDAYVAKVKNTIIDTANATEGMGWAAERLPTPKRATEFTLADVAEQLKDAGVDPNALANADPEALLRYFQPDAFAERDPNVFRRKEVTGHAVETLPDGTHREKPIYAWVNYKVDPDIALAVHSISNIAPPNLIARLLSATNEPVRALATTNNPAWATRNAINDYINHAMQSKAPIGKVLLEIPREHVRSLMRKTGSEDPISDWFERLRGETSMAKSVREISRTDIDRIWGSDKTSILTIAAKANSLIKAPGEHIELMPRLAEFRRTLVDAGYDDVAIGSGRRPPAELVWQALHNAAEVTTDFANRGRDGSIRAVLFGNAIAQSGYRTLRNFSTKEALKRTLPRVAAYMLLSAVNWSLNHETDAWKEMPAWAKYSYFPLIYNNKVTARFGIGQDWGIFHAATTAGLDAMKEGKTSPLWAALYEQASRFSASPALVGWAYQEATNKDAFGRPIETEAMKGTEPKDRYNPGTTETSKIIANRVLGNAFGISPVRVEHTLDAVSAGFYRYAARSVEKLAGVRDATAKDAPLQARDIPVLGGFAFGGEPSKSVQAFYDARDKQTQKTGSLKLRGIENGPEFDRLSELNRYGEVIKGLRDKIRDERDRDTRFEVEKYIIGLSRRATGEKELDRYPDPFMHPPQDPALRQIIDKVVALEAKQASAGRPQRGKHQTADDYAADVAMWEAGVKQSRAFLASTGYSPDEIRTALINHAKQRMENTQTVRDGKLTPFGQRLRRLSTEVKEK